MFENGTNHEEATLCFWWHVFSQPCRCWLLPNILASSTHDNILACSATPGVGGWCCRSYNLHTWWMFRNTWAAGVMLQFLQLAHMVDVTQQLGWGGDNYNRSCQKKKKAKKLFVVHASERLICCFPSSIGIHEPSFKNTRLQKAVLPCFLYDFVPCIVHVDAGIVLECFPHSLSLTWIDSLTCIVLIEIMSTQLVPRMDPNDGSSWDLLSRYEPWDARTSISK